MYAVRLMKPSDNRIIPPLDRMQNELSPTHMLSLALQVAKALEHVHRMGIVHGDVKLENVLLDVSRTHAKLCDFGLAGLRGERREAPSYGTIHYMAPELAVLTRGKTFAMTPSFDMWSLGVVVLAMLSSKLPWNVPGTKDPLFQRYITRRAQGTVHLEAPWVFMRPEFRECLLSLLSPTPQHRMTSSETVQSFRSLCGVPSHHTQNGGSRSVTPTSDSGCSSPLAHEFHVALAEH